MKRWIILLHRYLGIPMSIVFVLWFLTGIVMMYTGDMPGLSPEQRLAGRGAIDFDAVTLAPAEAAATASLPGPVTEARLMTLLGRPAYRLATVFGAPATVFADTGEVLETATIEQGIGETARFFAVDASAVSFTGIVREPDQWTITQSNRLPLVRFDVADGRGTRAYFSSSSGEIELVTDDGSRALAWIGAIPHWFYFTPLRTNQPAWYWTVVWVSLAGCVMAGLGIVLAFTQFRRSRPFRLSASIRYRGWMRWHYYTGALFGVFALTWVFSGLMSMQPFDWSSAPALELPPNDLSGGPLPLERYDIDGASLRRALDDEPVYEVDLLRLRAEPYLLVAGATESRRRIVDAATLTPRPEPFDAGTIIDTLRASVTTATIRDFSVLDRYDGYYYARGDAAPLPALRVKFDDPADTWYYFDLNTSQPVYANHRLTRLERWLFNGLHSLDFNFWYNRRPLWDIGMILLSLGALATSAIGMYLGLRRLFGFGGSRARA